MGYSKECWSRFEIWDYSWNLLQATPINMASIILNPNNKNILKNPNSPIHFISQKFFNIDTLTSSSTPNSQNSHYFLIFHFAIMNKYYVFCQMENRPIYSFSFWDLIKMLQIVYVIHPSLQNSHYFGQS